MEFIKLLLQETDYKPTLYFSKLLNVSSKTLQKELPGIEKYLSGFGAALEKKTGTGIKLCSSASAKKDILNQFSEKSPSTGLSLTNRRLEILKTLLINTNQRTSIQKLSEQYFVGKASIVNDLKYVEDWLASYQIKLSKTVEGTSIEGKESAIRSAIAALLSLLDGSQKDTEHNSQLTRLDADTFNSLTTLFNENDIIKIESLLINLEQTIHYTINEPYYINLLTHILICLKRVVAGNEIKDEFANPEIGNGNEGSIYQYAVSLVDEISREFLVTLPETEIHYIYRYLSSAGLEGTGIIDDHLYFSGDDASYYLTQEFIRTMSRLTHMDFNDDEQLFESLILHFKPMLNRLKYKIHIHNPLLPEIGERFQSIITTCQFTVDLLAEKYGLYGLSLDEISYVAIYFQAAAEKHMNTQNVIVVCNSGFGTSQLLTTRIKKAFPQWNIVGTLSVRQLNTANLDMVDFIISTVRLDLIKKPFFIVSALLSDDDIRTIRRFLSEGVLEHKESGFSMGYIKKILLPDNIFLNQPEQDMQRIIKRKLGLNKQLPFKQYNLTKHLTIHIHNRWRKNAVFISLHNDSYSGDEPGKINFYFVTKDSQMAEHLFSGAAALVKNKSVYEQCIRCKHIQDAQKIFMNIEEVKMDFTKVIKNETIKLDMDATTKEEALEELTNLLAASNILTDPQGFLADVYDREKMGLTGIGNHIAIPHGKSKAVTKTSLAIGRTKVPIAWETLDEEPVQFIILFAVTDEDKSSVHLNLLSKVAATLGDDDVCVKLMEAKTPEEILDIFVQSQAS